jgi:hypothetical protein
MPLSALHVMHVCKLGTSSQCKYLLEDELDPDVFQCLKKSSMRAVAENTKSSKFIRKDVPDLSNNDNCPGYPILRQIILGYDQKNS